MATIGSLSVKLGLITVEWDQATDKAKKQAKDLQNAFNDLGGGLKNLSNTFKSLGGTATLTIGGIAALTRSTLSFADSLVDLANGYDLSISKTLQFRNAIQQSGGSAEGANRALSTLYSKISEGQRGNIAALKTFQDIGIEFDELKNLRTDEAITRVFDALAKGTDGNAFNRVKAIKELLGKTGMQWDINNISQMLKESDAEWKTHEAQIRKVANANDQLKQTMDNLKIAFADLLSPFLGKDLIVNINTFKAGIVAMAAASVVGGLIEIAGAIIKINAALKEGAKIQAALTALQGGKGIAQLAVGGAAYFLAKKAFDLDTQNEMAQSQSGNYGSVNNSLGGNIAPNFNTSGKAGTGIPEVDNIKAQVAYTRELLGLQKQVGQSKIDAVNLDEFEAKRDELALQRQQEILTIQKEYNQNISKEGLIKQQINAYATLRDEKVKLAMQKEADGQELLLAQLYKKLNLMSQEVLFAEQLDKLNAKSIELEGQRFKLTEYEYLKQRDQIEFYKQMLKMTQEIEKIKKENPNMGVVATAEIDAIQKRMQATEKEYQMRRRNADEERQRQLSFSEGWAEAYRKYIQESENASIRGIHAFQTLQQGLENMIAEFIKTGKLNFKSFADMIISEIVRIQAQKAAAGILGLFGGGGSSLSDIIGYAPMGSSGTGSGVLGFLSNILPFASGGDPPVGKASLVGENGPELFVPKTSGTIIPNNSLSSTMGSQPQIVYNAPYIANMSAIDTQSGIQFLAKNKQTIWASYQSASRSIPQNR